MLKLAIIIVALCGLEIEAPKESNEHSLVTVKAKPKSDKSKILWIVLNGGEPCEFVKIDDRSIVFTGPPGTYHLFAIDIVEAEQVRSKVTITGKQPPTPPPPKPDDPKPPTPPDPKPPTPTPDDLPADFLDKLQAAYGAMSEPDKATQRDNLAAMYQHASGAAATAKDWSDLFKSMKTFVGTMPSFRPGALQPVQEIWRNQMVKTFPECQWENEQFKDRDAVKKFFAATSRAMKGLK